MKTQNAKPVIVKKSNEAKKEVIKKVLITKASEKNAIQRPTNVKDKNFIYKYQLDAKLKALPEKKQKQLRSKLRRNLQLIVNKVILANVKKTDFIPCKEFISFYKENYILNDFSLKSVTNSSDELKVADLTKVLDLCKKSLAK
jgi:hypothetical protein